MIKLSPHKDFFLACLIIFFIPSSLSAQSFKDMFISKDDGAVDMSEFLNSYTGFLPVPIIVTEPAVGFGGGHQGSYLKDRIMYLGVLAYFF